MPKLFSLLIAAATVFSVTGHALSVTTSPADLDQALSDSTNLTAYSATKLRGEMILNSILRAQLEKAAWLRETFNVNGAENSVRSNAVSIGHMTVEVTAAVYLIGRLGMVAYPLYDKSLRGYYAKVRKLNREMKLTQKALRRQIQRGIPRPGEFDVLSSRLIATAEEYKTWTSAGPPLTASARNRVARVVRNLIGGTVIVAVGLDAVATAVEVTDINPRNLPTLIANLTEMIEQQETTLDLYDQRLAAQGTK